MHIVLEHVQIWKSPCTFFLVPASHVTMTSWVKKILLTKPITFGLNRKRILCWSIFAIEPIAGFCLFMGYWTSNNASRDHGIKYEFVSLAKPIVLCTFRKRILCWSILGSEPIANFCPFLGYWTIKNGSRNHDVKGDFLLMRNLLYLVPLGR